MKLLYILYMYVLVYSMVKVLGSGINYCRACSLQKVSFMYDNNLCPTRVVYV